MATEPRVRVAIIRKIKTEDAEYDVIAQDAKGAYLQYNEDFIIKRLTSGTLARLHSQAKKGFFGNEVKFTGDQIAKAMEESFEVDIIKEIKDSTIYML